MAFPFSDLPAAATITTAEQMLAHLPTTEEGVVVAPVEKLAAHVLSEKDVVTISLTKKKSGELTGKMNSADDIYDDSFCFFRDAADLNSRRTSRAVMAKSSQIIADIIEKHGRTIHNLGRAEQIGKTESMIAEFLTPENQAHLNTSGLMADFEDTRENHNSLKALMEESANLESIKGNVIAPYKAGRALSKSLRDLYDVVEINARIGEPEFITTLDLFDESLKKIRPMLKSKSVDSE